MRRVGHKGADRIAPGNTAASFDAALAAGVDMIEFDVLPADWSRPLDSPLVLAHDEHGVAGASTLEAGLAHLAEARFDGIELDVDLKLPGYEARVVEALRAHGLVERSLISTQWMRSLVEVRRLEPALRLGWSVPRVRRDYTTSVVMAPVAYTVLAYWRSRLPGVARAHLAAGRCDAVMAHWRLVTRGLVRAVHEEGGELYVWTVDDAARIGALQRLGVSGVITNDPRLFGQVPPAPA
jgi:glycerophosphoryl diester phosphodiesterase